MSRIQAFGGSIDPPNGLEALAEAIDSDWEADKRCNRYRNIIVICTDREAKESISMADLWKQWESINARRKRIVLLTPDEGCWETILNEWSDSLMFPSEAGQGMDAATFDRLLNYFL